MSRAIVRCHSEMRCCTTAPSEFASEKYRRKERLRRSRRFSPRHRRQRRARKIACFCKMRFVRRRVSDEFEARPDQLSVEFSSAFPLDLSKASDEITPHAEGEPTFLGDLNIAISGGAFSDLIFSLSMADTDNENGPSLTISAYDGSTEIGSACLTGLRSDQETTFAIVARSGVLTRVELRSSTGIRAARNFQVSGIGSRKRAAGAGHRGAAPHARQPAQSDPRRRESPRLLLCLQRQPGRRAGGRRMKPKT